MVKGPWLETLFRGCGISLLSSWQACLHFRAKSFCWLGLAFITDQRVVTWYCLLNLWNSEADRVCLLSASQSGYLSLNSLSGGYSRSLDKRDSIMVSMAGSKALTFKPGSVFIQILTALGRFQIWLLKTKNEYRKIRCYQKWFQIGVKNWIELGPSIQFDLNAIQLKQTTNCIWIFANSFVCSKV